MIRILLHFKLLQEIQFLFIQTDQFFGILDFLLKIKGEGEADKSADKKKSATMNHF